MTAVAMKTETKQILDTLNDEQIALVFEYLQKLLEEHKQKEAERAKKMAAFAELEKIRKKISVPPDFDYKKELMEALDEKYGSID